jgi:hypothetical protein
MLAGLARTVREEVNHMSTYNMKLLKFPGNYGKKGLPYGPQAYVALKASTGITWHTKAGKEKSSTVFTPECRTVDEFRCEVSRLIKELETIGKQAEKFFAKDTEKRKSELAKRT